MLLLLTSVKITEKWPDSWCQWSVWHVLSLDFLSYFLPADTVLYIYIYILLEDTNSQLLHVGLPLARCNYAAQNNLRELFLSPKNTNPETTINWPPAIKGRVPFIFPAVYLFRTNSNLQGEEVKEIKPLYTISHQKKKSIKNMSTTWNSHHSLKPRIQYELSHHDMEKVKSRI